MYVPIWDQETDGKIQKDSFNKHTPTLTEGESFSLSTKGDRQCLKPHAACVTCAPKCKYQTTGKYTGSVLKYRVMGKRTQHYYFLTH
jgi:hypothetical protein